MPASLTRRPVRNTWADTEIAQIDDDHFGFRDYASVLADRARDSDTPLTIGIFGPWGSGKTSLMKLMQSQLQPALGRHGWLRRLTAWLLRRPSHPIKTIWINVWQLSSQEQLWHAFLQALLTQVHKELPVLRRLMFDWRLLRERIDRGELFRQLLINSYRILIVIVPLLLARLWPASLPASSIPLFGALLDSTTATGGVVSLVLGLWLVLKPVVEAAKDKVSLDLGKILKDAPYEAQVSALQRLQDQFGRMVDAWVGHGGRLAIFVDDLDRCSPDTIAAILEALKLFTTTERCVYTLGLDYVVVRQALAKKYEFAAEEAAEYLEKIVQIPFYLPPLEDHRIADFVQRFYSDIVSICPNAPIVFSRGLEPNPRKVKRALNIYRTLHQLAEVRFAAWEMDPIDPELLAKIVVIQSRFHHLHDYLIREPEFLIELESAAHTGKLRQYYQSRQPLFMSGIGTPEDKGATDVLVSNDDLPALEAMLVTGNASFGQLPPNTADLWAYIYLTSTAKTGADKIRPNRDERNDLLSNDRAQIETRVTEILGRWPDDASRKQFGDVYVKRLEAVFNGVAGYKKEERQSANRALAFIEIALSNDKAATQIVANEHAVARDSQDAILQAYLARAYYDGFRDYDAKQVAARALKLDPQSHQVRELLEPLKAVSLRPLNPIELGEVQQVFGSGLDVSRVRVSEGGDVSNWLGRIGAYFRRTAPAQLNAVTVGNTSRFPVRLVTFDSSNPLWLRDMGWLMHELTHQWQYQHVGMGYLNQAIFAPTFAYAPAGVSANEALKAFSQAGRHFKDFNREQQGDIVRDYYFHLKQNQDVSGWDTFITEVRTPPSQDTPARNR
jgi:hypothetical protein